MRFRGDPSCWTCCFIARQEAVRAALSTAVDAAPLFVSNLLKPFQWQMNAVFDATAAAAECPQHGDPIER